MGQRLIRDKVPDLEWSDLNSKAMLGRVPVLSSKYVALLRKKLLEEVGELFERESLDEFADVHEVLMALLARKGYTLDDLLEAAHAKREARGGFTLGITWDWESKPEDEDPEGSWLQ